MMTLPKFEMALHALMTVDMQELVDAGAIADRDYVSWDAFQADRVGWLLAHPSQADRVWHAMWGPFRTTSHTKPAKPIVMDNVVELAARRAGKR